MGLNFPNAPIQGQVFAPVGAPQYVFLDGVWRVLEAPQDVGTAQSRNRIVNGAMQISQENSKNTTLTANNTYLADQWSVSFGTTGAPSFICRDITVASGDAEAINWIRLSSTVADTSLTTAENYRLIQVIEANRIADFRWGTSDAKPAILRFKARSSIVGTFAINLREYDSTCNFIKHCTFTAANVWQTFTIHIPPCTIGTWNIGTSAAMLFQIWYAQGSTTFGTDGAWNASAPALAGAITNWLSAIGQTFDIANVGLYLDPLNTGIAPPWEMPDEAEELLACKRYWEDMKSACYFSGGVTSGLTYYAADHFSIPKRIVPSVTGVSGTVSGFPATTGTIAVTSQSDFREARSANATSTAALYSSTITGNARM